MKHTANPKPSRRGSGSLDGHEFAKGLREMGLDAPKEAVGAIFAGVIAFGRLRNHTQRYDMKRGSF